LRVGVKPSGVPAVCKLRRSRRSPIGLRITAAIGSNVWIAWTTICTNCNRRRKDVADQENNPVTASSDREIVISRVLDAPRTLVFDV
jgi:hypothetical protein